MDYTITPQYHEKKDCYIYVVRLTDRVGKDDFTSLSELAKSHKGYYSSYRGVNGFVFKTEEQAEEFCKDMVRVWDVNHTPPTTSLSSVSTSDESSAPSISPSSGMELHKALRAVIQTEGEAIITEVRLVNILDDFKAYSEMPTAKYILRAIIADGFAQKLLLIGNWNNDAVNLASRFAATTGFLPSTVSDIFQSLAFGLKWISNIQKCQSNQEQAISNRPKTPHTSSSSKPKRTIVTWKEDMDDDETENCFLAMTEIDEVKSLSFGVELINLTYFKNVSDNISLSCEVRNLNSKKEYVFCTSPYMILKVELCKQGMVQLKPPVTLRHIP